MQGTFGLKMGSWGKMGVQRDFWVKKWGFGENGHVKGLLG